MATDRATAILVEHGVLECSTARAGGRVVRGDRVALEPAGPDGSPAPGAVLAEALRARCGRVRGPVTVGLPADQVLLKVVSLPVADKQELADMMRLQGDKFSPFSPENTVSSYEVLEQSDTSALVLMAVTREDVVNELGRHLRSAGCEPRRIDVASLGRWQVLKDAGEVPGSGRHVIAWLDQPGLAEMVVCERGLPLAVRTLDVDPAAGDLLPAQIADEVDYTLMSLEAEHGAGAPASLTVWCRGQAPAALRDGLAARLACPVHVRSSDALPNAAAGLARRTLAPEPALDLTPSSWRTAAGSALVRRRLLGSLAAVLVLWVLSGGVLFGGTYVAELRLRALKAQAERVAKPAREVRELRSRVMMLERYTRQKLSALECLREVASVQPPGVDLAAFTFRRGETLKISGEAADVNVIYDFKNRLDASAIFSECVLRGPTLDARRNTHVFDVEIKVPEAEE